MLLSSFPAIVIIIIADISGMGVVENLLFPKIHSSFYNVIFTALLFDSNYLFALSKK